MERKGSFLHGAGWLSKVSLVGSPFFRQQLLDFLVIFVKPVFFFFAEKTNTSSED